MHSPCVLPVFRSPDDDALFLLQLVLRAVFLGLDGIEHLFLLLRGDTRRNGLLLPLLVAFALLVRLRRILLPVALLLLVIALLALVVLLLVAVLFVLSVALLLLILVLVFVLVLVVAATAAVLVVVYQALGVGVVVLGLLVGRVQPQRLFVAFERLLVFLLLELGVAQVVERFGTLPIRTQRVGRGLRIVCSALSNRSAL